MTADTVVSGLLADIDEFLREHNPDTTDRLTFLRARFDAGLAWVQYPEGLGGRGLDSALQPVVDSAFASAGAPDNAPHRNVIGLGMAAPTISRFARDEDKRRWLRPLWTGEEIWCQLFSEPGAGSDLATVATKAVRDGDDWIVSGQKVWTSLAHEASWALLIARTDPTVPKHRGLSYFVCDMSAEGVDVRPLRQLTGEAEFNEVFLDNVRVPDAHRFGELGEGWKVTQSTLMNERVAIGAGLAPREGGPIGFLTRAWRDGAHSHNPALYDRVLELWIGAEAARLTTARLRQQMAAGLPGPEGSGAKLTYAKLAQQISSVEVDLAGHQGLRFDDYSARRPDLDQEAGRPPGYRFLRTKGNSIEGGTSEIMRNIIAERVLGLPAEPRVDVDVAWKDLPR
ncbi:Acyl-CoA dehydrogenase FadE34 (plasmid) [Rhodococcus ruber]|uniref:acyl-CoA dehydrogenase family protein n=1 Tax=Rhodococcus ruber TaxID=1830 RepID=UPI00315C7E2F